MCGTVCRTASGNKLAGERESMSLGEGRPLTPLLTAWRDDLLRGFALLTRVPFLPKTGWGEPGHATRGFPLVGAFVGICGAAVYAAAMALGVPTLPGATLAVAATILITGAFHEDGLADGADGLGGSRDRQQKLAIMRDSRIGTYGVLALIISVALRIGLIAAFPGPWLAAAALIATHSLSRGALPAVMFALPPARTDGLAVSAGAPTSMDVLTAIGIAAVFCLVLLGPVVGIVLLIAALATTYGVVNVARRQIGGYTGDILGLTEQLLEIVLLLGALILL